MVFIHGIAAKLMAGIAFTVVVSLFTSLLVAIFLIPALASILIKKPSNADIDPGSQWIERKVLRILKTPLRALAVAAALTGLAGLGLTSLGTNLLPPQDPDRFSLSITTADGQKAEETNKVVELIESMIHQAAQGQVAISLAEVGRLQDQKSDSFEQMTRRENQANLTVLLREGSPSVDEIRMRLSPLFKTLHHVEIEWLVNTSTLANALEQEQQDVVIEVAGKSLSQIQSTAKQLLQQLRQDPQLWNIQSSIEQAAMEYSLLFDRRLAASYGLSLQELEVNLQAALGGVSITQMTRGDEQTSVVINNPSLQEGELANLTLWSETGHWIRLGDIADIRLQPAANQILRRNQERVVELTAMYAANTELQQARQNLHALVAGFKPPVGVAVRLAGGEVARSQNMTELNWAIVLAVLLVFMLLAGSFESFLQPFTVLSSVPLALIGVACALVPLGQPIGIMVMLGLVVLSGIAVNDSILLVQKAQQLIASGVRPHAALAKAAAKRLRPIIMTTATTVAALLPLGLGIGESAELRAPLAWTVIGGLLTATLGSLTIVPCLYLVLGNFEKTTAATARPVELSELPYDKKAS